MQYAKRFWLDYDHEMTVAGVKVDPMKMSDEEFKLWLLWKLGYTMMRRKGTAPGMSGSLFEALHADEAAPIPQSSYKRTTPRPTNSIHPKYVLRTPKARAI